MLEEDRIFDQKGKSLKQKEKEADELYKKWVKVFSRERFEQYVSSCFRSYEEYLRAKKVKQNG